ncbi:MAG TPA: hypothetical protein GXZ65_05845 [Clostridiales bacterium]|jgi:hypothetical protein|nr:hypothetical protein [Clostridiales bacterium]
MDVKSKFSSDIETLKELMYDEAYDAKYSADLARRRCPPSVSNLLMQISREESCHLCRLQAEYYILTGTKFQPCVANINIPCNFLDALRELYHSEAKDAEIYLDAAAATADPRLSELYNCLSAEEAEHADEIACLIASCMCNG